MRAKPGQLLAYGHLHRKTREPLISVEYGLGVDGEAARLLEHRLTQSQYSVLHWLGVEKAPGKAFTDELTERGYDLVTFRFSIFRHGSDFALPKRLRTISVRAGVLHARWARCADEDVLDLHCAWHRPGHRGDVNLFFALMSQPLYLETDIGNKQAPSQTLQTALTDMGFDLRTLRFSINHSGSTIAAPASL